MRRMNRCVSATSIDLTGARRAAELLRVEQSRSRSWSVYRFISAEKARSPCAARCSVCRARATPTLVIETPRASALTPAVLVQRRLLDGPRGDGSVPFLVPYAGRMLSTRGRAGGEQACGTETSEKSRRTEVNSAFAGLIQWSQPGSNRRPPTCKVGTYEPRLGATRAQPTATRTNVVRTPVGVTER
jgi:hypothetical protein